MWDVYHMVSFNNILQTVVSIMDPRTGDADMERLEEETRANAIRQVAALLQVPR